MGANFLGIPAALIQSIKDRTKQDEQNIQQENLKEKKRERQVENTNLELFKSESLTSSDLHVVL